MNCCKKYRGVNSGVGGWHYQGLSSSHFWMQVLTLFRRIAEWKEHTRDYEVRHIFLVGQFGQIGLFFYMGVSYSVNGTMEQQLHLRAAQRQRHDTRFACFCCLLVSHVCFSSLGKLKSFENFSDCIFGYFGHLFHVWGIRNLLCMAAQL